MNRNILEYYLIRTVIGAAFVSLHYGAHLNDPDFAFGAVCSGSILGLWLAYVNRNLFPNMISGKTQSPR